MDYDDLRDKIRWATRDVEGIDATDKVIQDYIISGQRTIFDFMRLPEYEFEDDMTYAADADSVTIPTDVAWIKSVEIEDSAGLRTPVPVMDVENRLLQGQQNSESHYCYMIGRDMYLRIDEEAPSSELALKLVAVPLLDGSAFAWDDVLGTATHSIPDHHEDLLFQYLMWKVRMFGATKPIHFAIAREWRTEFYSTMRIYMNKRGGVARRDSRYTNESLKGVLY